ncbi:hypothetical protein [Microbulbifer sp. JTAC008]|uniref:hypothetical protein n=1 Tax=unclassified Microbulbifer TaxID=2619833 RepID=UPI00403926AD
MKRKYYFFSIFILFLAILSGCYSVGHDDFKRYRDAEVGSVMDYTEPFKYENSGKLIRADFLISGQGLTEITKNAQGDFVYHLSVQEVLPNFHNKDWVGKCLIYVVVDSESYIIKSWGFQEMSNPLSCRTWP